MGFYFSKLLALSLSLRDWVELLKDAVFLGGGFAVFKTLWNIKYKSKEKAIANDIAVKSSLKGALDKYVEFEYASGERDIGVRFIYVGNYPYRLSNDDFKQLLAWNTFDGKVVSPSYIDRTGVLFEQHLWFVSVSVYVDKYGIFFVAPEGKRIAGFRETPNIIMVLHLPYHNIIDTDFDTEWGNEPIFYIRYPYDKFKKLYDDKIEIRRRDKEAAPIMELRQCNNMPSYSWWRYLWCRLKLKGRRGRGIVIKWVQKSKV